MLLVRASISYSTVEELAQGLDERLPADRYSPGSRQPAGSGLLLTLSRSLISHSATLAGISRRLVSAPFSGAPARAEHDGG